MAELNFPITNNKDITYPVNLEKEKFYPVWYESNWFELRGYNASNQQVVSSNWGENSITDTIWIGKDVDFVKFALYNDDSAKFQLTSLAFEEGRTDFQNIFVCKYEISENNHSIAPGTEEEFTDIDYLPFRINTSIRIPKGVSNFPGITLEAPFDLPANALDSWTCRVFLPKTVTSFNLISGDDPNALAASPNQILINPSQSDEYFSLNSDKGIIEIYLLEHTDGNILNSSYPRNLNCTFKFFFNEKAFARIMSEQGAESEEEMNEHGIYQLKTKKVSGFEAKVAEALGTSSLDIAVNPLTIPKINEIIRTPVLEILDYYYDSEENPETGSDVDFATGTLQIITNNSPQNKYIDFKKYDISGVITAEFYTRIENTKVGIKDVSSELSIVEVTNPDETLNITFSFQGGSVTVTVGNGAIIK